MSNTASLPSRRKLNLGCGRLILDGYVNADIHGGEVRADAEHLPFKAEVFDEVLASHLLEHVSDLTRVMSEIHGVLKVGGTIRIYVPYGLQSLYNPFHVRAFGFDTMSHFCTGNVASLDHKALFRLREARISSYLIPFRYHLVRYGVARYARPFLDVLKRLFIRLNLYVRAHQRMRWRVPLARRAEMTFLLEKVQTADARPRIRDSSPPRLVVVKQT